MTIKGKYERMLNTELAIKNWKKEHDNIKFNWNDERFKYYLMYDNDSEEICFDSQRSCKLANTIYFSSRDKVKQCIEDIGEERIVEWLRWEDNDQ